MQVDGGELAEEDRACRNDGGAGVGGVCNVGDVAGQGVELGVGENLDGEPVAGAQGCVGDVVAAAEAVGDFVVRESHSVGWLVLVDAGGPHGRLVLLEIVFVALRDQLGLGELLHGECLVELAVFGEEIGGQHECNCFGDDGGHCRGEVAC